MSQGQANLLGHPQLTDYTFFVCGTVVWLTSTTSFHSKDTTQTRKRPGRRRMEEALWYSLYGRWFCQEKPLLYCRQSELSKGREANGQSLASDCANQPSESTTKQRYPCWTKKRVRSTVIEIMAIILLSNY